jgi:formate hydrogenlyase subunit 4
LCIWIGSLANQTPKNSFHQVVNLLPAIHVILSIRTFNVPPVAFASNLASDGDILVLYYE